MPSKEERAEEIRRQMVEVLRRNSDPIGVRDEPRAQNEYDAHVGGVNRLLATGASARQIAKHLRAAEALDGYVLGDSESAWADWRLLRVSSATRN